MYVSDFFPQLFKQTIEFQESPRGIELKKLYSFNGFLNEFATIKISLPRRSGHTTAIAAVTPLLSRDNFLVVVPYNNQRERLISKGVPSKNIILFSEKIDLRGRCINFLFIDNTFFLPSKKLKNLCETLRLYHDQNKPYCLVLMQT